MSKYLIILIPLMFFFYCREEMPKYRIGVSHCSGDIRRSQLIVSQITCEVGFTSPSYFSKCFKEEFGIGSTEVIQ